MKSCDLLLNDRNNTQSVMFCRLKAWSFFFFFFPVRDRCFKDSVYRRYLFHKNLKKVYDSQPSSITFCINCEISFTAFNLKSWLKTRNCIDFLNYKLVLIGATSAGFGNFCLKSYFVDLYIWVWKRFSDLLMFGL